MKDSLWGVAQKEGVYKVYPVEELFYFEWWASPFIDEPSLQSRISDLTTTATIMIKCETLRKDNIIETSLIPESWGSWMTRTHVAVTTYQSPSAVYHVVTSTNKRQWQSNHCSVQEQSIAQFETYYKELMFMKQNSLIHYNSININNFGLEVSLFTGYVFRAYYWYLPAKKGFWFGNI